MTGKLINIEFDTSGLSKPATKFIEVVAQGIGGIYKPIGTVLQAKADAKALKITTDAELLDISKRSNLRLEHLQHLQQNNIESVLALTANELPKNVSDEPVDQDWINQFFDHIRNVSNKDMQILWARILAGEIEEPGSFSKRTLNFIKTISREEANVFSILCSYTWTITNHYWPYLLIDKFHRNIFKELFGKKDVIFHISSIGLIREGEAMVKQEWIKENGLTYFDKQYKFDFGPKENNRFVGNFIDMRPFTSIGYELYKISCAEKVEGYSSKAIVEIAKDLNLVLTN